ncbi:MAG: hypothetical protein ACKOWF_15590, partial [Chloroflexota bacterium]
ASRRAGSPGCCMAAWNRELAALIRGEPVAAAVGVPGAVWDRGDEAEINEAIHAGNRDLGLAGAFAAAAESIADLRAALAELPDASLHQPRIAFDGKPGRMSQLPLLRWVDSCVSLHPAGHLPAVAELLSQGRGSGSGRD